MGNRHGEYPLGSVVFDDEVMVYDDNVVTKEIALAPSTWNRILGYPCAMPEGPSASARFEIILCFGNVRFFRLMYWGCEKPHLTTGFETALRYVSKIELLLKRHAMDVRKEVSGNSK